MLPACRTENDGFAIPQLDLTPSDVDGFPEELRGFHTAFEHGFTRREPREHFFRSLVGQFSPLERKSIEPIALEVEGGNVRAMQRLMSDVVWDEPQMRWIYHQLVNDDLGDREGGVIFDWSTTIWGTVREG